MSTSDISGWPEGLHQLFHNLWTRDVGTPGYEKPKWKRLHSMIDALVIGDVRQLENAVREQYEAVRKTPVPVVASKPTPRRSVWDHLRSA